ncbi:hypothetical protein ACS0TY_027645 [Phlomoides rotata]
MSQTPPKNLSFLCFIIISALFTPSICINTIPQKHVSKVKGMFVFGSSLVDNGNNNFLTTSLAKADFSPYGVDFPLGPSGRFTNGRNVVDILGQKLKIPNFIPPFNHGNNIVYGVNFASGGSGILDNTGSISGNVTNLNQQIRNFESVTLPELRMQLGDNSTGILSQYLFVVGTGGNDYTFNYFLGLVNRNVSLEEFTTNLTATLSHQLKMLYDLGARKFVLLAINPNGCSPMATARLPTQGGCVESLNRAAHLYNANLRDLVLKLRLELPSSALVFIDTYTIMSRIIGAPSYQGFRDATNPCCEVTQISEGGSGILCKRGGSVCTNRDEYVFFDGLHPTEAVNVVIATKAFSSSFKSEVYPFNVRTLSLI